MGQNELLSVHVNAHKLYKPGLKLLALFLLMSGKPACPIVFCFVCDSVYQWDHHFLSVIIKCVDDWQFGRVISWIESECIRTHVAQ